MKSRSFGYNSCGKVTVALPSQGSVLTVPCQLRSDVWWPTRKANSRPVQGLDMHESETNSFAIRADYSLIT